MINFNINSHVKVKLNEIGMDILEKDHEKLRSVIPRLGEFKDLRDEEGYMKVQLWSLMQQFGPHISLGSIPPFDTEILVEDDNDLENQVETLSTALKDLLEVSVNVSESDYRNPDPNKLDPWDRAHEILEKLERKQ